MQWVRVGRGTINIKTNAPQKQKKKSRPPASVRRLMHRYRCANKPVLSEEEQKVRLEDLKNLDHVNRERISKGMKPYAPELTGVIPPSVDRDNAWDRTICSKVLPDASSSSSSPVVLTASQQWQSNSTGWWSSYGAKWYSYGAEWSSSSNAEY